jgi:hypothetical protein
MQGSMQVPFPPAFLLVASVSQRKGKTVWLCSNLTYNLAVHTDCAGS